MIEAWDETFANTPLQTSAITGVFMTAELMENITCNLDHNDLHRCTRVCRKFADVVKGTPTTQKTLFLKAQPSAGFLTFKSNTEIDNMMAAYGLDRSDTWFRRIFSLYHEHLAFYWRIFHIRGWPAVDPVPTDVSPSPKAHIATLTLHPALKNHKPYPDRASYHASNDVELSVNPLRMFKMKSWEDAFIAQPPPLKVHLGCRARRSSRLADLAFSPQCNIVVKRAEGVRLRDVRDTLRVYAAGEKGDGKVKFEIIGPQSDQVCRPFTLDRTRFDLVIPDAVLSTLAWVVCARELTRESEDYKALQLVLEEIERREKTGRQKDRRRRRSRRKRKLKRSLWTRT